VVASMSVEKSYTLKEILSAMTLSSFQVDFYEPMYECQDNDLFFETNAF